MTNPRQRETTHPGQRRLPREEQQREQTTTAVGDTVCVAPPTTRQDKPAEKKKNKTTSSVDARSPRNPSSSRITTSHTDHARQARGSYLTIPRRGGEI